MSYYDRIEEIADLVLSNHEGSICKKVNTKKTVTVRDKEFIISCRIPEMSINSLLSYKYDPKDAVPKIKKKVEENAGQYCEETGESMALDAATSMPQDAVELSNEQIRKRIGLFLCIANLASKDCYLKKIAESAIKKKDGSLHKNRVLYIASLFGLNWFCEINSLIAKNKSDKEIEITVKSQNIHLDTFDEKILKDLFSQGLFNKEFAKIEQLKLSQAVQNELTKNSIISCSNGKYILNKRYSDFSKTFTYRGISFSYENILPHLNGALHAASTTGFLKDDAQDVMEDFAIWFGKHYGFREPLDNDLQKFMAEGNGFSFYSREESAIMLNDFLQRFFDIQNNEELLNKIVDKAVRKKNGTLWSQRTVKDLMYFETNIPETAYDDNANITNSIECLNFFDLEVSATNIGDASIVLGLKYSDGLPRQRELKLLDTSLSGKKISLYMNTDLAYTWLAYEIERRGGEEVYYHDMSADYFVLDQNAREDFNNSSASKEVENNHVPVISGEDFIKLLSKG